MRILMLSEFMPEDAGCGFRVRERTAMALAQRGHDVTFAYPSTRRKPVSVAPSKGSFRRVVTPTLLPRRYTPSGFAVLDTLYKMRLAASSRYDVIHVTCGHRPSALIPAMVGKWCRRSTVIDEWWEWFGVGGYGNLRKGLLGRLLATYDSTMEVRTKRWYDGIVAITHVLASRLPLGTKSVVLHGGAESETLLRYSRDDARQSLGIPRELFIIGISNVDRGDHADNTLAFDAFSKLMDRHESLRLLVTGDRHYIAEVLQRHPFSGRLIAPGWVSYPDYNKYLSACDVFALPLRDVPRNAGRWPNKIGDYLAVDRPILTNPTGDLASLFGSYRIGRLCEASTPGFYAALSEMVANRNVLQSLCPDSAIAAKMLSFEKRIESLETFYAGPAAPGIPQPRIPTAASIDCSTEVS